MTVHARSAAGRVPAAGTFELSEFPAKASLGELLEVTVSALAFWPPLWLQSFLGPARHWLPPYDPSSELNIVDPRRAARALEYLSQVSVPAMHRESPAVFEALLPRLLNRLFWRPTEVFEQPAQDSAGRAFPRERWFFINGIATNVELARINARLLSEMFHRPITVIQNATNCLALDVRETAVGKEFKTDPEYPDRGTFTEPGLKATLAILEALTRPEIDRVVVVAHSQGTVIIANVLRALSKALRLGRAAEKPVSWMRGCRAAIELTSRAPAAIEPLRHELAERLTALLELPERGLACLEKLEIYTFANCADKMKYVARRDGRCLPRIEHFANQRDWVARLGILSPYRAPGAGVDIDGPLFERRARRWPGEGWGHLLNDHYLLAIRDYLEGQQRGRAVENPYRSGEAPAATPRLYAYFGGREPHPVG